MIPAQDAKWVNALTDHEKDNDSFTAVAIDTSDFDYAELAALVQGIPADMTALKVQECDTSGGTYADVTGAVFGTSTAKSGSTSTLPTGASDDDTIRLIQIDLRGRKRYLKVVATAGDGSGTATELTVLCRLSRAKIKPDTAAEAGAAEILCL